MRHPFAAWLWWMSDHFDIPPELRLDPMPTTAGVALIDPDVVDARELMVGTVQQQRHASAILNIGGVHFCAQDQAASIDQDVTLATIDPFGTVVAADSANAGRANRLAIDDGSTRLRVAADTDAELLTQDTVEVLPGAVQAPKTEVVIGGLPSWELVRKQPPGTAAPHNVEDGIQDLTDRVQSRSANAPGWRQKWLEPRELGVRQVGQVGSPQGQTPAILPVKPTHVPVFRQSLVA